MNVVIKKSKIHGKGVFASHNFKKGETIIRWDPTFLSKKKIGKLNSKNKKYISLVKGKYVLMNSPEKYVNHSCNPNSLVKRFSDFAKRNIKKGEEITTDYSKESIGIKIKCKCGSKNCKKIIMPVK